MSDLVAWIKDQVRRSQLKELIKAHTGLTPPAFMAVVALAAGTALTVSAVSSFLTPPKQNDKSLDEIIDDEIMPYSPANQREVDVIPVFLQETIAEATKEEEEEEAEVVEAPVNAVEAPVMKEEVVEAPAKEEMVIAPTAPGAAAAVAEADGDINSSSSDDDDFAEVINA